MLNGSIPALITPFQDNRVDTDCLSTLIEWQIQQGSSGILVRGTTGEMDFLNADEQALVVKTAHGAIKGRVPLLAGVFAMTKEEALRDIERLTPYKIDAVLVLIRKPIAQEEVLSFYTFLDHHSPLPIMIYHFPKKTGLTIHTDILLSLSNRPNIIGMKERDPETVQRIKTAAPHFTILGGSDTLTLELLEAGIDGGMSGLTNVVPKLRADLFAAWKKGDKQEATRLFHTFQPLAQTCSDYGIASIKYATSLLGKCRDETRAAPLNADQRDKIKNLIQQG